jgi:L-asparaginase
MSSAPSSSSRPRICVLATGGTIAGAQSGSTHGGYRSAALSIEALVSAVPQIAEIADLELEQIARIGSQDMDDALWLTLASHTQAALARQEIAGVVITHGTDTMEETAYFLNLVLKSNKPVVLVGAMRPATAISADGPMNLYNAIATAAQPQASRRGVLIVANDEIHSARAIVKTNTTQVGTFKSINRGLAGLVNQGRVQWFGAPCANHTLASEFNHQGIRALPRVEIIYAHAGMGRTLIDAALAAKAEGIVIAGVGSGNLSAKAAEAASEAAAQGIALVRASRTGGGMVERNVEVDDDKLGFIAAGDLNPQKARVLLQLGLTRSHDSRELQTMFDTY